ncbi:hypothetical protein BH23VER1_BH23VER1_19150 [soil metagenome]
MNAHQSIIRGGGDVSSPSFELNGEQTIDSETFEFQAPECCPVGESRGEAL